MKEQTTEIIPYLEFLKRSKRSMLRPAIWRWKDVYQKLMESMEEHSYEPGRGGVSLLHKDVGDLNGVSPTLNVVVQILEPGVHNKPHRHTNMALFLVLQGIGYSIIDNQKFEWEKGDMVMAPAWSEHEHCNTSDTESAILVTFQDVPLVNGLGVMFLEEPIGTPIRHVVRKDR